MVIQCDHCQAKFKLDDSKVGPKGVKVRCTKCKEVFVVKPTTGGGVPAEPAPTPTAPAQATAAPAQAAPAQAAPAAPTPPTDEGGGIDFGTPPTPEDESPAEEDDTPSEDEDLSGGFDFGSPPDTGEAPAAPAPPQEEEEADGSGFDFGSPPDTGEAPAATPPAAQETPSLPADDEPLLGGGGDEFELDTGREEDGGMDSFQTGDTGDAFGGFDFGGGQEEPTPTPPPAATESTPGLESSFSLNHDAPGLSLGGEEQAPPTEEKSELGGGALDGFSFGEDAGTSAETPAEETKEPDSGFSFDFNAGDGEAATAAAEEEKTPDAGGETIVFSIDDTMSGGEPPKPKAEEPSEEGKSILAGFDEPIPAPSDASAPTFTADSPDEGGGDFDLGEDATGGVDTGAVDTSASISAMADEGSDSEKPKKKFKAPSISIGAGLKKALAAMLIILVLGGGGFYAYTTGIVDTLMVNISGGGEGADGSTAQNIKINNLEVKFYNNKHLGFIMAIKCNITNLTDSNQAVSAIKGITYGESNNILRTQLVSSGRILSDLQLTDFTEIEIKKTFRDTESNPLAPRGTVPVMVVFTDITADIVKAEIEIIQ